MKNFEHNSWNFSGFPVCLAGHTYDIFLSILSFSDVCRQALRCETAMGYLSLPLRTVEVLLLAVYHTVISLQNLTTNEHVPSLSGSNICYLKLSFFLCGKIGS